MIEEKIAVGNKTFVYFHDPMTISFSRYGYIDGLTQYSAYIKTGDEIPIIDIEDGKKYIVKISFKGDLQIKFFIGDQRFLFKKYYPGLDQEIIDHPQQLTVEQFEKIFSGDMFKIFIGLRNKEIYFRIVRKNSTGGIKMNIDKMIKEYTGNNGEFVKHIDKEKLNKLLSDDMEKAIQDAKDKSNLQISSDKSEKERIDNILKAAKKSAADISMGGYVEMLYQRIRRADFMYRKSDVVNLINSMMTQQGVDLRGVSGTGKDSIAKILCMLSCENYDEQVLEISASVGLELDDKRVLGYQHGLTGEYQYSKYLIHIKKSNKDIKKPFFQIMTEANLVNLDKSFSPITSSMDSAFKKITLPRYGNINNDMEPDPEFTDNNFILLTTNDYIGRKDLSPKDKDRMMIIGYNDPFLRRMKDLSNDYKPISPEPVLAELFKRHVLNNEFRKMSIRDAYRKNGDYKIWADEYNDKIAKLYDELNEVLRINHMENLQIANRLQDATNKYLFVAALLSIDEGSDEKKYEDSIKDQKSVLSQKLAFDRFLCQKFITKLEGATDIYLKCLKEIKTTLSKESNSETGLLPSEADCIKMLENIIWRIKSYEQPDKSELDIIYKPEEEEEE